MVSNFNETMNAILASGNGSKHILHLYAPSVNKYAIHANFLSKKRGTTAYVTGEKPDKIREEFDFLSTKLSVIHPSNLEKIRGFKNAIIDAASITPELCERKQANRVRLKHQIIHERKKLGQTEIIKSYVDHIERENYLHELKDELCVLCTYDISRLEPDKIRHLVETHQKFILTTDDTMILSSKSFSSKNLKLNAKNVEQSVKNELGAIILTLVSSSAMCGNDIKKKIYEKFDVLLSSGTLYPLLHKLEKQGLVKCTCGIKTKTYKAANEVGIRKMLNESIQTKKFLNGFMQEHAFEKGKENEE